MRAVERVGDPQLRFVIYLPAGGLVGRRPLQ